MGRVQPRHKGQKSIIENGKGWQRVEIFDRMSISMRKITLRSILFISYALALAIVFTVYITDKTYFLNFYILPILFGAYYFDIYGGVILTLISTGFSMLFMHMAGNPIADTAMITQIVIFALVGMVSGIFQKENNKLNNFFLIASLTDKLTNLYNYGYFTKRMAEEIERAQRYKHNLALIMIDVDLFKEYNDAHGHQKGNQVLIRLADIFMAKVRKSDVVFRYGGEEFAIILPETGEDVMEIAESIRKRTAEEIFPGNIHLTVSAGVAHYPYPKNVATDLIEQADKALYEAKETGRNRVVEYRR